jgi:type IV secretory pathway VirB2 component (pilin)
MRFKLRKTSLALFSLLVPVYTAASADRALAMTVGGNAAGGALPWVAPLSQLAQDLTGPTAASIAIIAIFVSGLALIFGEDLGKFARSLLMIVIALSMLIGAAQFIGPLTAGAIVP